MVQLCSLTEISAMTSFKFLTVQKIYIFPVISSQKKDIYKFLMRLYGLGLFVMAKKK